MMQFILYLTSCSVEGDSIALHVINNMITILINIAMVLCSEISVTVSQTCSFPNEEYRDLSCETYCRQYDQSYCLSQEPTSGCFCSKETVRSSETRQCISVYDCSEEICGPNQIFNAAFGSEEVCSCNGTVSLIRGRDPITKCECSERFIRYIDWEGECITRTECEEKRINHTC